MRAQYLIVDGHSVIFSWPELRTLHQRRQSLARDALIKKLRQYQDWTGTRVAVVFDGKGSAVDVTSHPEEIQIFYSREGQTADSIVERLASKYAAKYTLLVATDDVLEQETASAAGAECISTEGLRWALEEASAMQNSNVEKRNSKQIRMTNPQTFSATARKIADDQGDC